MMIETPTKRIHINPLFIEKGQRVYSLRKAAGLTRESFSKLTGMSAHTLRAIEIGSRELTESKARVYAHFFNGMRELLGDQAYQASFEYLFYGTKLGSPIQQELPAHGSDDTLIQNKIELFANNPFYILLNIPDELMSPYYNNGDIVAGKKIVNKKMFKFFQGRICIIESVNGDKFLRQVMQVDNRKITAYTLNHNHANMGTIEEIDAACIAQAIFHWRLSELVPIPNVADDEVNITASPEFECAASL